jgi:glycosyltransferase involved in cell wall biosynthesis
MSPPSTTTPAVTIAMPTIGRMEFLPGLFECAAAQTFGDFEALILDNASPPDAQAFYAEWARKDPRFRTLRLEERVPMFTNYNRGFTNGRGKYMVIFNDDDLYLPRFLEKHHEFLEAHPNVAFAGPNGDYIDEKGTLLEARRWISRTEVIAGRRYIEFVMTRGRNLLGTPGIVYRMSALAPDGIDDRLSCYFGDFVLLMRLAEKGDVGLLEETLVQFRRHENQHSVKSWKLSEAFALRDKVFREYLDELRARYPHDPAFLRAMERGLRRSLRVGSVWGWMCAPEPEDAQACLDALRGTLLDDELRGLLRRIDGLGLNSHIRRTYLAPWVRRVGNALRV